MKKTRIQIRAAEQIVAVIVKTREEGSIDHRYLMVFLSPSQPQLEYVDLVVIDVNHAMPAIAMMLR